MEEKEDGGGRVSRDTSLYLPPHRAHSLHLVFVALNLSAENYGLGVTGDRMDSQTVAGKVCSSVGEVVEFYVQRV